MQEARREALQCAQRAAKLSPFEIRAQYSVVNAQHDLAEWETDQNRKLLFPVYVNINRLIDEMVKWDPENKDWRRQYAATLILLADGYAFIKYDEARAEQVYGDAEHELTELRKIDSTNHSLEMDFEWLYRDRGGALSVAGLNGAGEQYDKALAILDNLRHIDSTNRDIYDAWSYLVIQRVRLLAKPKYSEAIRLAKRTASDTGCNPLIKAMPAIESNLAACTGRWLPHSWLAGLQGLRTATPRGRSGCAEGD
jgi:tetratricopeptide (TPR) repeat protein